MLAITHAGTLFGWMLLALLIDCTVPLRFFDFSSVGGNYLVVSQAGNDNLRDWIVYCVLYELLAGMITTLTTVMVPALSPSLNVVGTGLSMAYACSSVWVLVGSPVAVALSNDPQGIFLGAQAWSGTMLVLGAIRLVDPWIFIARKKSLRCTALWKVDNSDLGFSGNEIVTTKSSSRFSLKWRERFFSLLHDASDARPTGSPISTYLTFSLAIKVSTTTPRVNHHRALSLLGTSSKKEYKMQHGLSASWQYVALCQACGCYVGDYRSADPR